MELCGFYHQGSGMHRHFTRKIKNPFPVLSRKGAEEECRVSIHPAEDAGQKYRSNSSDKMPEASRAAMLLQSIMCKALGMLNFSHPGLNMQPAVTYREEDPT